MQTFPDERSVRYLRARNATYVLVRQNFYEADRWTSMRERLDRSGLTLIAGFPAPGNELLFSLDKQEQGTR
jgi:hypothetical protein